MSDGGARLEVEPLPEGVRGSIERIVHASTPGSDPLRSVEPIWERRHVLRVTTGAASAVVKLAREMRGEIDVASLQSEVSALSLCNPMPNAIAPRLFGFDSQLHLVVMEDLPVGRALADVLLLGDASSAKDAVGLLARGLASIHAYTGTREEEYRAITADFNAPRLRRSWLERAHGERDAFLRVVGDLVDASGVDEEVTVALERLETSRLRGLVHGDLCPDNVRITDDGLRLFDFEASTFGPIAIDVAYLLAPFPSCWCFAELPDAIALGALETYEHELTRLGVENVDDLRDDVAAALACFLVAWLSQIAEVLEADEPFGTSTARSLFIRLLTGFANYEASALVLPRLTRTARSLIEALDVRWPDAVVPRYPAFAPLEDAVAIPEFWRPGL